MLGGAELPGPPPLDAERRELAEAGKLAVLVRDREVVVAAPDAVGVLYRTVGVLALHLLDIRQASIRTYSAMAVNSFVIEPRFGRVPDPMLLRADLARALAGELPLAERLREKERAYAERARNRPPTITWFDEDATDATVLEIRTEDSIGLLTRITAALERAQLDVRSAQVSTLGHAVTGAFYLTDRRGARLRRGAARRTDRTRRCRARIGCRGRDWSHRSDSGRAKPAGNLGRAVRADDVPGTPESPNVATRESCCLLRSPPCPQPQGSTTRTSSATPAASPSSPTCPDGRRTRS